jgi:hypothetical protein
MVRAVETADLIHKELSEQLPVSVDPLLCEGKSFINCYLLIIVVARVLKFELI